VLRDAVLHHHHHSRGDADFPSGEESKEEVVSRQQMLEVSTALMFACICMRLVAKADNDTAALYVLNYAIVGLLPAQILFLLFSAGEGLAKKLAKKEEPTS
jgi:hypothetical protein